VSVISGGHLVYLGTMTFTHLKDRAGLTSTVLALGLSSSIAGVELRWLALMS
jgi:hypothetical protein